MPLTWRQFVQQVEAAGVQGGEKIDNINVFPPDEDAGETLIVRRHPDGYVTIDVGEE